MVEYLAEKPKGLVEIRCPVNNPEAYDFAVELEGVLKKAGWQTTLNNRVIITPTPVGLRVLVSPKNRALPQAIALMNLFENMEQQAFSLNARGEADDRVREGETVLLVGFKP
jgi:hypothetical protein